jgi:uncharacterized membrane protein
MASINVKTLMSVFRDENSFPCFVNYNMTEEALHISLNLYVLLICLIEILSSYGVTDSHIETHKFAIRDVPQIYIIYISITRLCPAQSSQKSECRIHPIHED